jgi:hypothetical protein
MEEPSKPILRGGAGWMLHLAEMAVVKDARRMQPAEFQARIDAYFRAKGLPEVESAPRQIKAPPI